MDEDEEYDETEMRGYPSQPQLGGGFFSQQPNREGKQRLEEPTLHHDDVYPNPHTKNHLYRKNTLITIDDDDVVVVVVAGSVVVIYSCSCHGAGQSSPSCWTSNLRTDGQTIEPQPHNQSSSL